MFRLSSLAVTALCLFPLSASALELKNVRPSYGPLGATRQETKCVPGDVLFITYDIEGLKIDDKTGRANFKTLLELIDSTNQVAFSKETPNDVAPQLGGTRMPGDLFVQGLDVRREQAVEAEARPLFIGEGSAFVPRGGAEEPGAVDGRGERGHGH